MEETKMTNAGCQISDEFRVTLRVRNNPLLSAIESAAPSVAEFCRTFGFKQQVIGNLINLKLSPLTKKLEWRPAVMKLADVFGVLPDELFPVDTQLKLTSNAVSFSVGAAEAAALLESDLRPDALLEQHELAQHVTQILDTTLTPREKQVVSMRYGIGCEPMSLEEIAQSFDVSKERIRQIEVKALRKIRHPSQSKNIRPFLSDGWSRTGKKPHDSFCIEEWVKQAVEQGLACSIDKQPKDVEDKRRKQWFLSVSGLEENANRKKALGFLTRKLPKKYPLEKRIKLATKILDREARLKLKNLTYYEARDRIEDEQYQAMGLCCQIIRND